MKLAALYSGGKDSTLAVYDSIQKGHDVIKLVSMDSRNPESYMFHFPNIKFTSYQAEAMGIPHVMKDTKGEKEKELKDLRKAIENVKGIEGIIAGGLASKYQYNRIQGIADALKLKTIVPYWKIDSEDYWNLILEAGFRVMIIGVACEGLGKEWLGRVVEGETFRELKKLATKHRFHLAGEGGEFESFVLDGPNFKKKLEVRGAETIWDRDSGMYLFKNVKLVEKN
ncbi:MAG: diphthine--ammonia ligase [Candidatus Aenigmatarchaeota archaeon]